MSNFGMGVTPENLYQTPEIEELKLDVNNSFLDTASKGTGNIGGMGDGGED